jgi:alkylation response protein AidB-like acyl-CoA dehydrogenase
MDVTEVEISDEFLERADAFLSAHAKPLPPPAVGWGEGSDAVVERDATEELEREHFERARAWRTTLYDGGFGWLTGPVELGGAGLTKAHQRAFDELAGAYDVPHHVCFVVGLDIVAPTILGFGTDEAKGRYLKGLHRGDVIGCQLFSEPDAGSDLAGVKSRAVRDGDGWRVTGQKVWTSGAHHADIGEMLVRTDPSKPKHRGLTMLTIDMHAPGVEVRPLRQITGSAEFNEVFLDDVFVPDADVLGAEGQGWVVANATLGGERESMGGRNEGDRDPVTRLIEAAQHFGVAGDPVVRQWLAELVTRREIISWSAERFMATPGAAGSLAALIKLMKTNAMWRMAEVAGSVLGPRFTADTGEWGTYAWATYQLSVPSHRIAGGTDEIMRNVIGERVLGLPREPRVDESARS